MKLPGSPQIASPWKLYIYIPWLGNLARRWVNEALGWAGHLRGLSFPFR